MLREALRLIESREEKARLKALREATRIGTADMKAGRFRNYGTPAELTDHVLGVAERIAGAKVSGRGSR